MKNKQISVGGPGRRGWGGSSAPLPSSTYLKKEEITIQHTDFQGAFLTKSNTLYNLPAGAIVLFIRLKPSVIFTGGAITNYFLFIGIAGKLQDLMTEYEARNIVVGNQEYAEAFSAQSFDFNNTTALQISARSVGANLAASVSGTALIEIYYIDKVA